MCICTSLVDPIVMCQLIDRSVEAGSEGNIISPTNTDQLEGLDIRCSVQLTTTLSPSWVEVEVDEFDLPTDCGACARSLGAQCSNVHIDVYPNYICDASIRYAWKVSNQILRVTLTSPEYVESDTFNISYKGR